MDPVAAMQPLKVPFPPSSFPQRQQKLESRNDGKEEEAHMLRGAGREDDGRLPDLR